ncbi:MAG: metallophosphoesterase family protein [Weeksellaceae bacterium]
MKHFIVGDIHGCYYTLKELLTNYWKADEERLILLGDLVNKGKHTFAVLEYVIDLKKKFDDRIVILKGNNEYLFEKYYRDSITLAVKQKFENYNLDYIEVLNWLDQLPTFYENGMVFISHAGVPEDSNVEDAKDSLDILFTKRQLKNIQKHQFVGHVVVDKPTYDESADVWYLDTGAGDGEKLTAARVTEKGKVQEFISLKVNHKDIPKVHS